MYNSKYWHHYVLVFLVGIVLSAIFISSYYESERNSCGDLDRLHQDLMIKKYGVEALNNEPDVAKLNRIISSLCLVDPTNNARLQLLEPELTNLNNKIDSYFIKK